MRGTHFRIAVGAAVALLGLQLAAPRVASAATLTGTSSNFQLVGHNSLFDRGVNAAGAIYDHYMYIGSRSDGTHPHSGVQIVDIADPTNPVDVGEIPIPATATYNGATLPMTAGYTSRELRVWPQQKVLMVIYFGCSALIHACASGSDTGLQVLQRILFFDLSGTNAAAPVLTSTYIPSTTPHEMFLWADPNNPDRALMYWTSPNNASKQLVVTDISGWRSGTFPEVATMATPAEFTSADKSSFDIRLHSLSLSPDGTRGYLAYLGGGVLVIDTSDLANNVAHPTIRVITPETGRAFWNYEGAHSAVLIPGSHYLFTTEEIYGKGTPALGAAFGPAFGGCPWGWARIVDMNDPTNLKVVSEFKIDENQQSFCANVPAAQDNFSAYTSHNPTVLPDQAFVTWHSGGLRAVDLTDPTNPVQDGVFVPTPETPAVGDVHTVDPALEPGSNGTIGWSYPIIRNGLIYYIDIANGRYLLRFTGPHADEVAGVSFLEGNSNLGDAARLAATPAQSVPESPLASVWLLLGGAVAIVATGFAAMRQRRHLRAA